jgi:hypothetical protein
MSQSIQPAIQHLFQASSLEAVSREQLETFVEDYPCFGFGHYLLSRKLMAENADQFLAATQKTSLYFSNPFWLQWMLDNTTEPASIAIQQPAEPAPLEFAATTEQEYHPSDPWPEMESAEAPGETTALLPDPEASSSAAELLLESIEKAKSLRDSLLKMNEDFHSNNGVPPGASETVPPPFNEAPIQDEEPPFILDEPTSAEPAPIIPSPIFSESPATPTVDEAQAPVITETTPLFEPLHTIDYFASQGIRLTLDENPTDPLGRQLKSFTEWLRTMRRLPQKDREIIPDRVVEQNIQNYAAHSIEGKEPVTETMAEVLAKQGMPERARIVYEKLSLLNPDKSAYFAAKIEQLNIH